LNTERPEKKMELIFKLRFYNIFSWISMKLQV
jgi:hypothetical protein